MRLLVKTVILCILVNTNILYAQFNEAEFFNRVETIYHSLKFTGLNNFSAWITSNVFRESTKEFFEEEVFPLEIIWKNPDQIYYIKRPLPETGDPETQNKIEQLQMDMLQELKGLLIDWQRFYAGNLLAGMPETYSITTVKDTVFIQYEKYEPGEEMKVKMVFGINGLCVKIVTTYPNAQEEFYAYPAFRLEGDKWLCKEWTVQILEKGQVESGFVVGIESIEIDKHWLPARMVLRLQKRDVSGGWFIRDYRFRNIVLNKDLKFLR